MTQNEERLVKAQQTAQFLLADIHEIHAKTPSVAVEELTFPLIEQVANISRLLGRLARESKLNREAVQKCDLRMHTRPASFPVH